MKRIWISLLLLAAQPARAQQYKPSQWITVWSGSDETYSIDYNRVKRSGSIYTVPMILQGKDSFSGWAHIDCKTRNYAISGEYGRTDWSRGAPGSAAEALADVLCKTASGGSAPWQGSGDSSANAGVRRTISTVSSSPPSTNMVMPDPGPVMDPLPTPSYSSTVEPAPLWPQAAPPQSSSYSSGESWRLEGYYNCLRQGLGTSFCTHWFN